MLRATGLVTLVGILMQAAGFLRTSMIAAMLGVSLDVDAYNLGLIAPTFIASVVVGWLQTGFAGRYAAMLANGETALAAAYRARMLRLVAAIALSSALVLSLQASAISALMLPAGRGETMRAAALALQVVAWTLPPIIIGDYLALVLNAHGRFLSAAAAPLASVLASVVALWQWPTVDVGALVWSLLIGNALQALVVIVAITGMGASFPLDTRLARGEVATSLRLAPALVSGSLLINAAIAIVPLQCARLGDGAAAVYGYASRLHGAASQILVVGLVTVLLPHLSTLWAKGAKSEILALYRQIARLVVLLAAGVLVGVLLMGDLAVEVLFARGRFDNAVARQVAEVWGVLSLALLPSMLGTFIGKLAAAVRDARALFVAGAVMLAVVWPTSTTGVATGSLSLVSASLALGVLATAAAWLGWLRAHVRVGPIIADIGRALGLAAGLLVPAVALDRVVHGLAMAQGGIVELAVRGGCLAALAAGAVAVPRVRRWLLGTPA
ncbi:MAG: lipid II flippase MurJ [Hyphomicrobiaceae bacterium]|nr:lipid II flippase MurJ [Hyphomicrobiaceae bacterium]